MPTMPSGPTRTSRYPRNMQRQYQYQQQPPRMSRRPPQRPQYSEVVPTGYQESDAFYDDQQGPAATGTRVTTSSAAGTSTYRR